jgi:hypothetical protein
MAQFTQILDVKLAPASGKAQNPHRSSAWPDDTIRFFGGQFSLQERIAPAVLSRFERRAQWTIG